MKGNRTKIRNHPLQLVQQDAYRRGDTTIHKSAAERAKACRTFIKEHPNCSWQEIKDAGIPTEITYLITRGLIEITGYVGNSRSPRYSVVIQ